MEPPLPELTDADIPWDGSGEATPEYLAAVLADDSPRRGFSGTNPVSTDMRSSDDHASHVAHAVERERTLREARRVVDAEERGPVVLPAFETLSVRLARPVPPTGWRVEGWQPRHARVMLTAQYKAGKTTVVSNYVRCVADGDAWLGRDPVEATAGTIVLLDFEMSASQLDSWLRVQRIRNADT